MCIRDSLYITGSNAHMLSSEIATRISGRYMQIEMLPLSFKEYMISTGDTNDRGTKYLDYLQNSSFPYTLELKDQPDEIRNYLEGLDVYKRQGQDYVRTAKAKGVARWKIIFKHTLRNAMIPVITYVGPMTAYILTGSLVVERIFTIGGLGAKFVDCIINRDYPMIMGTTIFLATLMITMNLITDIVYKMVDPRIKLD